MKPLKVLAIAAGVVTASGCAWLLIVGFIGSVLPRSETPAALEPASISRVTFVPTIRPTATDVPPLPTMPPPTPMRTDEPPPLPSPTRIPTRAATLPPPPPTQIPTRTPAPAAAAPTATPKPAAPPVASFRDGTYIVGQDISPGTYRTRAATSCYWARLQGFGGSGNDILANSISPGPAIVTILPTDKGFRSSSCGVFTQDISAITASPVAPFGDGTYLVNTDVAPGRWRSDGAGTCYWARLSNFTGRDHIIANHIDKGPAIVEISPSDRGFNSSGCGMWTKI